MVDPFRDPHLSGLSFDVTRDLLEGRGRRGIAGVALVCHDPRAVPTYDYQCRSCGSVTEVIHSMLEEGPSVCERCGGELRRVLYPTGIIFKGSGFYRTDSRTDSRADSRTDGTTPTESKPPAGEKAERKDPKPKASSGEATKGSGDSET